MSDLGGEDVLLGDLIQGAPGDGVVGWEKDVASGYYLRRFIDALV